MGNQIWHCLCHCPRPSPRPDPTFSLPPPCPVSLLGYAIMSHLCCFFLGSSSRCFYLFLNYLVPWGLPFSCLLSWDYLVKLSGVFHCHWNMPPLLSVTQRESFSVVNPTLWNFLPHEEWLTILHNLRVFSLLLPRHSYFLGFFASLLTQTM